MYAKRFPFAFLPAICLLFLALFHAGPVHAATAADFITDEYRASTGLASLKAADAYALGFTGKGVTVGVVDSFFAQPRDEFANKYPHGMFLEPELKFDTHGIHVSGIIAAARNGIGMHGTAFDASLMPFSAEYAANGIESSDMDMDGWRTILNYPEVKIVNNSWGDNFFLDTDYTDFFGGNYGADFWKTLAKGPRYTDFIDAATSMGRAGKLLIMAAGNEGHLSPNSTAGLPTMVERAGEHAPELDNSAFAFNWISVASYDPRYPKTDPRFISTSSNLGKDASEYTLLGPGSLIYSTVSENTFANMDPEDGMPMSGTSMATPYVSGVAALTQQAFPYMNGKQLADVLLSTATPMDKPGTRPEFIILQQTDHDISLKTKDGKTDYLADEEYSAMNVMVYTYAGSSYDGTLTDEQIAYFLEEMDDVNEEDLLLALQNVFELPPDEYAALFGQGIVNAYRAVQGPGHFNANRLLPSDRSGSHEFAGAEYYAMYGINTQGHDSIWSNDIGERRATSGLLQNLGVGLRKDGAGLLFLTGKNTYTGPTEILGGGISLGRSGYPLTAQIAGDVYVRDAGLFTGAGTVKGSLTSSGLLVPGFTNSPGKTLQIDKDVVSTGGLRLILGPGGRANRLNAGGDINLADGRLPEFTRPDNGFIKPFQDYHDLLHAAGTIHYPENMPDTVDVSPFLSFAVQRTATSLSLGQRTKPLDSLPDMPGRTRDVAGGLRHMFDALDGDPRQRQLDFLYNRSREEFLNDAASLRGDLQAATLTTLPLDGVLNRLAAANPLGARKPVPTTGQPERFSTASGQGYGVSFWLRPVAGYARADGRDSIGQDVTSSHMRGLVLGAQADRDDFYFGALLAVADGDVRQGSGRADITDVRGGVYGGWQPGGLRLGAVVTGGAQHYKTRRHVPVGDDKDQVKSSFDGYTFGLGAEASYNLLHGYAQTVALSPYLGVDLDYTRQEGRKESGNEVFALDIDSKDLWRTALLPGVKAEYAPVEWLSLSASLGYKRLLNGHRPTLDAGFKAGSSYRFAAVGPDEGRDFVTYSIGAEAALPENFSLAARFFGENSNKSRAYGGFINLQYAF